MSLYPNLTFPAAKNRPFFYSNFVETVDGKVTVTSNPKGYWPLGSATDRNTMIYLRTYADALIHGVTTAAGHPTLTSLNKPDFLERREKLHKSANLPYFVLSNHPDSTMLNIFSGAGDTPVFLVTTKNALVPHELDAACTVIRAGDEMVDLQELAAYLDKEEYKHVLMEGGPHVFGSFFAEDLIDELFVTIAPKIFGNKDHQTLTMVEGHLLEPGHVKHLQLLSVQQYEDDVYLRYRVKR